MAAKDARSQFRKTRKASKLANRAGASAASCVLHVMVNDRVGLVRESAVFLQVLERIWKERGVSGRQVWEEMEERLRLGEELRESGVRPYKSGKFRTTKLP